MEGNPWTLGVWQRHSETTTFSVYAYFPEQNWVWSLCLLSVYPLPGECDLRGQEQMPLCVGASSDVSSTESLGCWNHRKEFPPVEYTPLLVKRP